MKIRTRIMSTLCAAAMGMTMLTASSYAELIEDREYKINNVTIERTSAAHVGNCFEYASELYSLIWNGKTFDCSFKGTKDNKNMLYGLSDGERLITAEHTREFIGKAAIGAVIRITNAPSSSSAFASDSEIYDGKYGHNVIITAKDENGFYCLEDWSKASHTSYYTWEQFGKQYNTYKYYKYIKWPEAEKKKKAKKQQKTKTATRTTAKATVKTAAKVQKPDNSVISDGMPAESFEKEYSFGTQLVLLSTIYHDTQISFDTDYSNNLFK